MSVQLKIVDPTKLQIEDVCGICLDDFIEEGHMGVSEEEKIFVHKHSHNKNLIHPFHQKCLWSWIRSRPMGSIPTCPTCQVQILKSNPYLDTISTLFLCVVPALIGLENGEMLGFEGRQAAGARAIIAAISGIIGVELRTLSQLDRENIPTIKERIAIGIVAGVIFLGFFKYY